MAAEILLSLVFFGLVCWAASRLETTAGRPVSTLPFALAAGALFFAGLTLRVVLGMTAHGFTPDMDTFKAWGYALARTPLREIYRQEDFFLDYPPGYLYVLMLLEKLRMALGLAFDSPSYTLLLKLPSMGTDLLCAGVLLWAGRRRLGDRGALVLSGLYLFCPVVLANSAQWGQVDSVTAALLLASLCLLYREWYAPSALVYGFSIACKPQMLIFAPAYIFFSLKRRRPGKLLLGVAVTLGAVLLTAAPFTEGWDFLWLLQRYRSTLDYYNYYSINAYNFWTVLGFNWRGLPEGLPLHLLTFAAPVLATAACGVFLWKARRREAVFAAPVLLMTVMYLFGIKMHERYLYPVFLFLLVSCLFTRDRRLLRAFGLAGLAHHLNVAHVLWLFREKGGSYDPNAWATRGMALFQAAALAYVLWAVWAVFVLERAPAPLPRLPRPAFLRRGEWNTPAFPEARFRRIDWVLLAGITLLYACAAFWDLGDARTALTSWAPQQGDVVVLAAEAPCDRIVYLPGLAPDEQHYTSRVGVDIQAEISADGITWTDLGSLKDRGSYVFCWQSLWTEAPFRYLRLTALDGKATLNEVGLKLQGSTRFAGVTATAGGEALIDEQALAPYNPSYQNSTYFDEIYHARTAYEYILGLEPYENTHPPLGKQLISLGILLFGMGPFGWRFMGTLFGVLMLPVLYHLLKQLFGKPWLCGLGTALFALDFMHFTQTRIATIDTYAVFFLLLTVDAMTAFLRRDLLRDGWGRLLLPLGLSGLFWGLGVAAKWNVAYGGAGLAVLYFGKLALTARDLRRAGESPAAFGRRALILCGWCCLFFLAVPFGVYFLSFLPLTTLPHNASRVWGSFLNYQVNMYNYHANLVATHSFASPWYEWPLDVRPIWFFSADVGDRYSTIASFGNPLLWWAGIPALAGAAVCWLRERRTWAAVALVGYLSVLLPWVLVPRLTFIYHYFTAVPFLAVAVTGCFARFAETAPGNRRLGPLPLGRWLPAAFLAGCGALFWIYFPVLSGAMTDRAYVEALRLFPTWYF